MKWAWKSEWVMTFLFRCRGNSHYALEPCLRTNSAHVRTQSCGISLATSCPACWRRRCSIQVSLSWIKLSRQLARWLVLFWVAAVVPYSRCNSSKDYFFLDVALNLQIPRIDARDHLSLSLALRKRISLNYWRVAFMRGSQSPGAKPKKDSVEKGFGSYSYLLPKQRSYTGSTNIYYRGCCFLC